MQSLKTDVSRRDNEEVARLLINVNDYSMNASIQQIHRSLNILEHPLVTARIKAVINRTSDYNFKNSV